MWSDEYEEELDTGKVGIHVDISTLCVQGKVGMRVDMTTLCVQGKVGMHVVFTFCQDVLFMWNCLSYFTFPQNESQLQPLFYA